MVRLTNSLRVSYPAVSGEVNVVDFIVLETLRIFVPIAYESIRTRPEMFGAPVGWQALVADLDLDEKKAWHESWIAKVAPVESQPPVKELASRLFPRAASLLGGDVPFLGVRTDAAAGGGSRWPTSSRSTSNSA